MKIPMFGLEWLSFAYEHDQFYVPPGESHEQRSNIACISVKRCVISKKADIVERVADELQLFGVTTIHRCDIIKKYKDRILCTIPSQEVIGHQAYYEFISRLRTHFEHCVKVKWSQQLLFEKDTLQALLIKSLRNPDFKLQASIHYAVRHGAMRTIDLLKLIDRDWSIRY